MFQRFFDTYINIRLSPTDDRQFQMQNIYCFQADLIQHKTQIHETFKQIKSE